MQCWHWRKSYYLYVNEYLHSSYLCSIRFRIHLQSLIIMTQVTLFGSGENNGEYGCVCTCSAVQPISERSGSEECFLFKHLPPAKFSVYSLCCGFLSERFVSTAKQFLFLFLDIRSLCHYDFPCFSS
jgi:hypothetical protein